MRVPNARTDANYNQKYLNEKDKEFLNGFDWCVKTAVDNFFNNLDVHFSEDSHIMHMLNEELPAKFLIVGEDEESEIKTYLDLIRARLLDWIEKKRDELIMSMIDNMSEEEYAEMRAKNEVRKEANTD